MGLSCFRAISGIGLGWDWDWDLCAGLLYEHHFAMLIRQSTLYPFGQVKEQDKIKSMRCAQKNIQLIIDHISRGIQYFSW